MAQLTGSRIKGYAIRECLGTRDYAATYRATQLSTGREVAIKVIPPHIASHPDFIRCFDFETLIISRLEHPYIVPLLEFWRDESGAYFVKRWLPTNLLDVLRKGRMSLGAAANVLDHIAEALDAAHGARVIHQAIKPGNILFDAHYRAYLADFSIATDIAFLRSPTYLAPEQISNTTICPQTDIYSLGLVLQEMLVGKYPFVDQPTDFAHLPPDAAKQIRTVIKRATSRDPRQRYANARLMAAAFREAIQPSHMIRPIKLLPSVPTMHPDLPALPEPNPNRFTRKEFAALGTGITTVIVASLLTSLAAVAFPLNFLISLTLGGMAGYGILKVLDPRTRLDVAEGEMDTEYHRILRQLKHSTARITQIGQHPAIDSHIAARLASIAAMLRRVIQRFETRPRDFARASSTLVILTEFDKSLNIYLRIKSGDQFLDPDRARVELAETEGGVLPMFEQALETLGRQLDAGETVSGKVSKGTLESMLRSLNLIESLQHTSDSVPPKEVP